ncbi:MAG TPA: hypothetical protein VIC57_08715, partial [Candidatus Dormibacteraeota bacterium]
MGAFALLALAAAALLLAAASPDSRPAPQAGIHRAAARTAHALPYRQRPPPAPQPVSRVPAGRAAIRVPILMYHYIRYNPDPRDVLGFNLSVTPSDFARQMDWLAANGYHPIDFDDLRGYLLG